MTGNFFCFNLCQIVFLVNFFLCKNTGIIKPKTSEENGKDNKNERKQVKQQAIIIQ